MRMMGKSFLDCRPEFKFPALSLSAHVTLSK